MLRRRRRSLSVLGVGSVITVLLAAVTGGASWFIAGAFVLGQAGIRSGPTWQSAPKNRRDLS